MQKSKVGLDLNKIEHAKSLASEIAQKIQLFVDGYSTVAVERTLCRLLGIDGVDQNGVPLPNAIVRSEERRVGKEC